jgi:hypothetical protein
MRIYSRQPKRSASPTALLASRKPRGGYFFGLAA